MYDSRISLLFHRGCRDFFTFGLKRFLTVADREIGMHVQDRIPQEGLSAGIRFQRYEHHNGRLRRLSRSEASKTTRSSSHATTRAMHAAKCTGQRLGILLIAITRCTTEPAG